MTGGLSFFGGPGSNYLTHSLAAMVERIRAEGGTGFVHGVGMFNTKHHALVLADHPRDDGAYPVPRHEVGVLATAGDRAAGPGRRGLRRPGHGPHLHRDVRRVTAPRNAGAVIGTGAHGERFAAAVPDGDTLERADRRVGAGRHARAP